MTRATTDNVYNAFKVLAKREFGNDFVAKIGPGLGTTPWSVSLDIKSKKATGYYFATVVESAEEVAIGLFFEVMERLGFRWVDVEVEEEIDDDPTDPFGSPWP